MSSDTPASAARYQPPGPPEGLMWNPTPVAYHGRTHEIRSAVYPGRLALAGEWPAARPEECDDESRTGVWLAGGQILICPGCGLDCT